MKVFVYRIKHLKWNVFVTVFLLFFSYVSGVAVDLISDIQLFVRGFVLMFCVASCLFMVAGFSLRSCILFLSFLFYALVLYLINGGVVTLNFIYLATVLFFFYSLRVCRDELLFYSLSSSLLVVLLYLVYFVFSGAGLEPVVVGDRVRHYFGFANPNKAGIVAYSCVVLSVLYLFGRNKFVMCLICVPFVAVAIFSDSRTALYALALFVGLASLPFLIRFRRLVFLVPGILFAGSFYIASLNESDLVNLALSNRPIDFHEFISNLGSYDFLLGASSDGYRVDNSYLLAYFAIGPVGVLLFFYLLFKSSFGVFGRLEFAFIMSMMAYGLMEGVLVRVEFPVVMYFYYLILGRGNHYPRVGVSA